MEILRKFFQTVIPAIQFVHQEVFYVFRIQPLFDHVMSVGLYMIDNTCFESEFPPYSFEYDYTARKQIDIIGEDNPVVIQYPAESLYYTLQIEVFYRVGIYYIKKIVEVSFELGVIFDFIFQCDFFYYSDQASCVIP